PPPQPMTPLPMPTPQQPAHLTPLPMPTPATAAPGDPMQPAYAPSGAEAPMNPPMTPPSAAPSNGSASVEPTWRAAGTQMAASTEISAGPEPWVAAGTRNSDVMR